MSIVFPPRPLIFVAHPDDETLAFGGMLQRLPEFLVVIATDGAPTGYGLERSFGSLNAYGGMRFQETSRALKHIANSSCIRLTRSDGSHFNDQHLSEELPAAATSLKSIARQFAPGAIISHAYEGGHLDHDACSFLAMHLAGALALPRFEFPMYWHDPQGKLVQQKFRPSNLDAAAPRSSVAASDVMEWQLSLAEIEKKKKMMAEFKSQSGTVSSFAPEIERMRVAITTAASFRIAQCRDYMYQERRPRFYHTRHHRLAAKALLKKFAEFELWRAQKEDWRA